MNVHVSEAQRAVADSVTGVCSHRGKRRRQLLHIYPFEANLLKSEHTLAKKKLQLALSTLPKGFSLPTVTKQSAQLILHLLIHIITEKSTA